MLLMRRMRRDHPEYHRPQMLAGFQWRPHNPQAMREHRSFWIWLVIVLSSRGSRSPANGSRRGATRRASGHSGTTRLARPMDSGQLRPWEELAARAKRSDYERGTVPKGALVLMLGIDCQIDRVEYRLVGFGREYRRYVIDYGTIPKHIAEPDCQAALDLLVERKWLKGRP